MEGEAGCGEQSFLPVAGEAGDLAGLGVRQRDRRDAGRARESAGDGQGRVAGVDLQVSGVHGRFRRNGCGVRGGRGCRGEAVSFGEGGPGCGGAQLGEGGQGGVPADRVPGAGLGLVPGEGVFPGPECRFYWPAASRYGDEIGQGRGPALRRVAEVERVLVLPAVRQAPDQQELPRILRAEQRPARVARSLRAVAGGPLLEHRLANRLVSAGDFVSRERDLVVARDDDDVGQAQAAERVPELAGPAVHFVGRGPQHPETARYQAFDLRDGQFRLGGERQGLRDARLLPAGRVLRPAGRHVRVEIDPGLPGRGDQRGKDPGHAVLDLPGHPGVLGCHAGSRLPLAQVGGLVDRQSRPDPVAGTAG